MPAAYDAEDLNRRFHAISERLRAVEAQLSKLSGEAGIPYEAPAAEVPPEVDELIAKGDTKGAMKLYRELTGAGAEEARKVVLGA